MVAAAAAGAQVTPAQDRDVAVAALAHGHPGRSPTGRAWATVRLEVPRGTRSSSSSRPRCSPGCPPTLEGHLSPTRVAQALDEVKPGRVTAALLPAVELDLVIDVVRAGGLLPEKATSFQPKPSLGSFIRLLDE